MSEISEKNRDAMQNTLQELVASLLINKPEEPVPFVIQFLQDAQGKGAQPLSKEEKLELQQLKEEYKKLKNKKASQAQNSSEDSDEEAVSKPAQKQQAKKAQKNISDSEDSEEEFLDEVKDTLNPMTEQSKIQKAQKARTSVSAEVFGKYHIKQAYKAKIVNKSQEIQEKIKERLQGAFMFMSLEEHDLKVVIDAMEEKKVIPNETIITEGEPGEVLYIVESGESTCSKIIDGQSKVLKKFQPGDVFGELALLYNAPRAATIVADTNGSLWVLDRQTFNHVVKDASQKKRQQYEQFLATVPILQNMEHYERSKLADVIKETKFAQGEVIIKQGEAGETFYILVEGKAYATLNANPNEKVMQYQGGDYFGELALLRGEPRAANVTAQTDCKVIALDRKSFKRLLGPLDKILKRNMGNYLNYMKK